VASRDELLAQLASAGDDEPVPILVNDLRTLTADDVPEDVAVQPCHKIEENLRALAIEGVIARGDTSPLVAFMEEFHSRSTWVLPLGVEEYCALVREAVAQRQRSRGDVELVQAAADATHVRVEYAIPYAGTNLRDALDHALSVQAELLEVAEAVAAGVEDVVAAAEKRLQGWGADALESLVDRMRDGTAHEKGLALEELVSRLFNAVPGFTATGRILTETEEIDIRIQNASDDPTWRRESALLIAECKNWSGKCGKDEFVLFRSKLENRTGRVSCGFLISWNGFAETVTAEMLRGTKAQLLIVPIAGEDIRAAVRDGDFPQRLNKLHADAVMT
jgi:hypothetical protein